MPGLSDGPTLRYCRYMTSDHGSEDVHLLDVAQVRNAQAGALEVGFELLLAAGSADVALDLGTDLRRGGMHSMPSGVLQNDLVLHQLLKCLLTNLCCGCDST